MVLNRRADLTDGRLIDIIDQQNGVRIAEEGDADHQLLAVGQNGIAFGRLGRAKRNLRGLKFGHVEFSADLALGTHRQTEAGADRLHCEMFLLSQPLLPDKPGEAARSVTALTGLAAIRVVNAHKKIGAVRGGLRHDHLIATDAMMAVCDTADGFRTQYHGRTDPIEHDEIVAQ